MMKIFYFFCLAMLITQNCSAAEFCTTTSQEFQTALTDSENNNQHNLIKLAAGSYVTPGVEFNYFGNNNMNLTISGGWTELNGNPCGQQVDVDVLDTILDGNSMNRVLLISNSNDVDVHISDLSFFNGFIQGVNSSGGGLLVFVGGDITVERNAFINNEASIGAARIFGGNKTKINNNLFFLNHSIIGATVSIVQEDSAGVYFTNNTVISNSTDSNSASSGVVVNVAGTSQSLIANNLLWDNENSDLHLSGNGNYYLYNNDIGALRGVSPFAASNNFSLPPRFESGVLSFSPASFSPLINQGKTPCSTCPIPVPFDEAWALGSTDAAGNTRSQHGHVDIGAFESSFPAEIIFMNGFE